MLVLAYLIAATRVSAWAGAFFAHAPLTARFRPFPASLPGNITELLLVLPPIRSGLYCRSMLARDVCVSKSGLVPEMRGNVIMRSVSPYHKDLIQMKYPCLLRSFLTDLLLWLQMQPNQSPLYEIKTNSKGDQSV